MDPFRNQLITSIKTSYNNNYGKDNFDEFRFGRYEDYEENKLSVKREVKTFAKKILSKFNYISGLDSFLDQYGNGLNTLYENLNELDRSLLIQLITYHILGYKKVKLPTNTKAYWENLEHCSKLKDPNDSYDPNFMHFMLYKMDLNDIGFDIKLYYTEIGVLIDFINEQYAYKLNGEKVVYAEQGDVVMDCGGCWGDTALYFANCVGEQGKVYSFEFIPGNIHLFEKNVNLNQHLKKIVELVPHPVSDQSDLEIYFKDNGPGSIMQDKPFSEQTGKTTTISIDDFVSRNELPQVDFIKMDIEGAEPAALLGAEGTIRKFRPKLAIAIYHSMDDFTNIPKWILDLNLDYDIYLGHYTLYGEETVIFAKPRTSSK